MKPTASILVMGLPGTGKTTLAGKLASACNAIHYNADEIRRMFNDRDFSIHGREVQAARMATLCGIANRCGLNAVADFVCPTLETRQIFKGLVPRCYVIWCDREPMRVYADTTRIFQAPEQYHFKYTGQEMSIVIENVFRFICT